MYSLTSKLSPVVTRLGAAPTSDRVARSFRTNSFGTNSFRANCFIFIPALSKNGNGAGIPALNNFVCLISRENGLLEPMIGQSETLGRMCPLVRGAAARKHAPWEQILVGTA